ncbi:MAG: hypothetical protein J6127_06505 [Clostridiales bacterium]|nr:hypothetical protein [Clostridiales bacterium]
MYYKSNRTGTETGIYVVCSDKALLETINTMLSRKGVIGISDAEGKYHYFVDGRKNKVKALSKVNDIVADSFYELEEDVPDSLIISALKTILVDYDFDLSLIGTSAIFEIVRKMVRYREVYYHGVKELLRIAGENLCLSYAQTKRDIRYAVRKSSFEGTGIKTTTIFRFLADEARVRVREMKKAVR